MGRTKAGKAPSRARLSRRLFVPRVYLPTRNGPPRVQGDAPLRREVQAKGGSRRLEKGKQAIQHAQRASDDEVGHVLFTLENYKVSTTLGDNLESTPSYCPVLDTGAKPNLIQKDTLPDKWLPPIRGTRGPAIKDANRRLIRTTEAIKQTGEVGDLTTEVDFLLCETLSVPCILGCTLRTRPWTPSV